MEPLSHSMDFGFPEHSRNSGNIITAPEYLLVEITEEHGKNIQILGLLTKCSGAAVSSKVLVQRRSWKAGTRIRSNNRIRTHRFQSSRSNHVAWCSARPPKTSTREDASDIAFTFNFRVLLRSTWYSFPDLLTLRNYARPFLTKYSRS
jgi:hypothetical protein